jgi:hypothetical protein
MQYFYQDQMEPISFIHNENPNAFCSMILFYFIGPGLASWPTTLTYQVLRIPFVRGLNDEKGPMRRVETTRRGFEAAEFDEISHRAVRSFWPIMPTHIYKQRENNCRRW